MRKQIIILLALMSLTLSACVSQSDYDELVRQNTKLEKKIDDLDAENSELEDSVKDYKSEKDIIEKQYDELQAKYDDVSIQYDTLLEEVEKKADSEEISKLKDELAGYGDIDFFESSKGKSKVLDVVWHIDINETEKASDMMNKLISFTTEAWFDYDYISITMWHNSLGIAFTMVADLRTRKADSHSWLE